MTIPLVLMLIASCGAPASAQDAPDPAAMIEAAKAQAARQAQAQAAAADARKSQAGAPRRGYMVPPLDSPGADQFRRLVGMLMVRRSEVGGGPEHIGALIGEPCAMVPSGCVALIEPLHDWIVDDGDKVDPYVYAMLDKVLNIVGDKYHSIAALNEVERSFVVLEGWPAYKGPGASFAAKDSIQRMMSSRAAISFDANDLHIYAEAKGPNAKLAQIGVQIAGLYDDAPTMHLTDSVRALVFSKDEGTALAALKSIGRLERTQATLDLIRPLLVGKDGLPRRDVDARVQVEALEQTGAIAWQLWHQQWTETARPYRDAVKSLGQDARGDEAKGGYAGNRAVAEAAEGAFRSFPRPPGATTADIPIRP